MTARELILIAGMAAVTFGIRYVPMALAGRWQMPAALQDALKYVPPAVLTAIIAPAVFMPDGERFNVSLANPHLIAALIATLVAACTHRTALTLAVGMAALWLWQWLWH